MLFEKPEVLTHYSKGTTRIVRSTFGTLLRERWSTDAMGAPIWVRADDFDVREEVARELKFSDGKPTCPVFNAFAVEDHKGWRFDFSTAEFLAEECRGAFTCWTVEGATRRDRPWVEWVLWKPKHMPGMGTVLLPVSENEFTVPTSSGARQLVLGFFAALYRNADELHVMRDLSVKG